LKLLLAKDFMKEVVSKGHPLFFAKNLFVNNYLSSFCCLIGYEEKKQLKVVFKTYNQIQLMLLHPSLDKLLDLTIP